MNITGKFKMQSSIYDFVKIKLKFIFIFRDTYIERLPKESANDRNDRAIRKAVTWYENHLNKSIKERSGQKVKILLLSDDAENRKKAEAEGIIALSVRDYVRSLTETPHLQDKLSLKEYGTEDNNKPLYPPHLTLVEIHDGIKNGRLYQGSFMQSRENYLEGSVNVECFEKAVSSELEKFFDELKLQLLFSDPSSRS